MPRPSRVTQLKQTHKNFSWPTYTDVINVVSERDYRHVSGGVGDGNRDKWNSYEYRYALQTGHIRGEAYRYALVDNSHMGLSLVTNKGIAWVGAGGWAPPGDLLTEATDVCNRKVYARLKNARNQWDFAVTLGEARETASHLAGTAGSLVRGYRSLRRGDVPGAWRHLVGSRRVPDDQRAHFGDIVARRGSKDAANAWLEVSYAWLPLLGDIDNAAQYLAKKRVLGQTRPFRLRVKHVVEQEGTYLTPVPAQVGSFQTLERWKNFASASITYDVVPNFHRNPTLNELGFTNPWSVAWELLPLSFVVDWFVNVGEVLHSLHEFNQWKVVRGIQGVKAGYVRESSLSKAWARYTAQAGSYDLASEQRNNVKLVQSTFRRTTLSTLPTALPLRILVDNPFDLKNGQLASAAALLRQTFK